MTNPAHTEQTPILPMGSVLAGLAFFNLMDAAMKSLSISMGAYNAILWRVLLSLVLVGVLYFIGRPKMPSRSTFKVHIQRGIVTVFMAFLFFWGLVRVPFAEAVALSFVAPIIALYLAAVMLGEQIHRNAIYASLLGLAGVLVIGFGKMRGGYTTDELLGFGAILLSAILYAVNLVIQRTQALAAEPVEVSFFQNLIVSGCYVLAAPFLAVMPSMTDVPMLLAASVLSIASAMLMAWGYRRAEAQILINLEYSSFIWAALFGWIFFSEPVSITTIAGAILIVGGCVIATRRGRPAALKSRTIA